MNGEGNPVWYSDHDLPADADDGPFFENPGKSLPSGVRMASVEVYDHPSETSLLNRVLWGQGVPCGIIRVSNIVGPERFKRVTNYIGVETADDLRDDVLHIAFMGRKNDIHSHLIGSAIEGPAHAVMETLGNAIGLANDAANHGSIFTINGNYQIVMSPIQTDFERNFCDENDYIGGRYRDPPPVNPQWPIQFLFNNGHQKWLDFYGDVGRNVAISFDILNNDPINATIVELSAGVFRIRTGEERPNDGLAGVPRAD
ncbi:hypothetical protein [Vannielia sp.]|uniref:hypothetical protein n=1 Tax=Vannielia sp. TaxID=2813045 RepID=UPI002613DB72|nr:hypothetical protein [Vannielia sp.]MDF1873674.1 hypothetical protein [Vannielia sp.]